MNEVLIKQNNYLILIYQLFSYIAIYNTRWACFNDPDSESFWVVGWVADTNYTYIQLAGAGSKMFQMGKR